MGAPKPKKPEITPANTPVSTPAIRSDWSDQFRQLKLQFISRANERIEAIKNCFLRLQTNPSDMACLLQIKQHFHWLAGSSSTYSFDEITPWGSYGEELCEYLLKLEDSVSSSDMGNLVNALNEIEQGFDKQENL